MSFTSEQIAGLLHDAQRAWSCPIRINISAGAGCTVLEIFDRDAHEPSVPMQRMILKPVLGDPEAALGSMECGG